METSDILLNRIANLEKQLEEQRAGNVQQRQEIEQQHQENAQLKNKSQNSKMLSGHMPIPDGRTVLRVLRASAPIRFCPARGALHRLLFGNTAIFRDGD